MIVLFQLGGADDFTILQDALSPEKSRTLLDNSARLLRARGEPRAAEILKTIPFRVVDATNYFNDEFSMLHTIVPLETYERLRYGLQNEDETHAFKQIATVLSELGTYIRFITAELILEPSTRSQELSGQGLTKKEIYQLVYKYIGVYGGYLGDFSYRTHHEFYIELDLDINPYNYDGTTRERFTTILSKNPPNVQATILEGILQRYPVGSSALRTQERHNEIHQWIARLRSTSPVDLPDLRITSEIVKRALQDAQGLIKSSGATSGVDRIHTALHGYLKVLCQERGIRIDEEASLPEILKQLCKEHPAFSDMGPRSADILRILRAMGAILDALNPLRNKASVAHPNAERTRASAPAPKL